MTTPGTPATAPSRAQHDEWVRYVREIGYTHKRIRHDEQTAEQRGAWGRDDWHCICGSWGGPFGDYAYALHLEDVIREASAPITPSRTSPCASCPHRTRSASPQTRHTRSHADSWGSPMWDNTEAEYSGAITDMMSTDPDRLYSGLGSVAFRSTDGMNENVAARFWPKVKVAGPDDCWEWQASRTEDGYGWFVLSNKVTTRAHRVSWMLAHGDIPQGLYVLHGCDNPPCVNPAHLSLGTHAENMADMVRKGRSNSPVRVGEQSTSAKLTVADVRTIRERAARGEPRKAIAADYRVSLSLVGQIVTGRVWRSAA